MTDGRAIPPQIQRQLSDWDKFFRRWWVYHYALGISATVASITVASNPKLLHPIPNLLETLAWLAAWRILHLACARYAADSTSPLQDLLDAAKKGCR